MKFPVYDYRQMEGGRPAVTTYDVPPELETIAEAWVKNDWVIGIIDDGTDDHVSVAAVDYLSDVVLHKIRIECAEPAEIFKIMAVDSAVITAAQRQQIKEGTGEPAFPEDTTEEA